ncbi:MAG: phosphoribosylamine--glycine ligase [Calditrichia bacterium]
MRILVLGSGGREHALVWKIKQSARVKKIYCIPGNAGIAEEAECHSIPLSDFNSISDFISRHQVDLTVVGPEQPLVAGIVDYLKGRGHSVFGPGKAAARLEGSKIFSKNFMQKYHIPTASYADFREFDKAVAWVNSLPDGPLVIKADGLAAGKGSIICQNREEARAALTRMMVEKQFADAGRGVVIEEFMEGEEASLFVITDGSDYILLPAAQDYKRAMDKDMGKNTGGMGSYAPTPFLTGELKEKAVKEIVEPVLAGLVFEGIHYEGVLYCGLMLTGAGPKVVEFNCRFGDPETQVVLPLLETDLVEILQSATTKNIGDVHPEFKKGAAVCVVAASGGYPEAYQKDKEISGLDEYSDEVMVFHAGTRSEAGKFYTAGGRVLGVTATGPDIRSAAEKAYRRISGIQFEGMQYRKDISTKAWE